MRHSPLVEHLDRLVESGPAFHSEAQVVEPDAVFIEAVASADHWSKPVLDYLKSIDDAGHLQRIRHPDDGRAVQLALNSRGVAAQARANAHWEVVRKQIEGSLRMPKGEVRAALQALDAAAAAVLETRQREAIRRR